MKTHRRLMTGFAALAAVLAVASSAGVTRAVAQSAVERMQEPGAEAQRLARRAGTWNVVITMHPAPGAQPLVWRDLIAERRMVGLFLEEVIRPKPGSNQPDFRRVSYLTYNKLEGRWQYVSLDTRFPAGIMPAYSVDRGRLDEIVLEFEGLAFAGWGDTVDGWLLRSSYAVSLTREDSEIARQFWTRADGSGTRWLGVQYDYSRQ